jgi:hypothetical protein
MSFTEQDDQQIRVTMSALLEGVAQLEALHNVELAKPTANYHIIQTIGSTQQALHQTWDAWAARLENNARLRAMTTLVETLDRQLGLLLPPQFQHNCDQCVFLGRAHHDGTAADLYFCPQTGTLPTVLARYSNEPSEYLSGIFATETPLLVLAKERAVERGLYQPT